MAITRGRKTKESGLESDRERAARRARRARGAWVAGTAVLIVACLALAGASVLRDACTRSFDRSPSSVLASYLGAVSRGDLDAARACWDNLAYFSLEAGCSEVCLTRAAGVPWEVQALSAGESTRTEAGREQIEFQVQVACPDGSSPPAGRAKLETVGRDLPWRHWVIVQSTIGGSAAEPWCR